MAELLGVTLGPKGRNVVLHNKYGPPRIVNDGETVLKEVLFLSFSFLLFSHSPITHLDKLFYECFSGACIKEKYYHLPHSYSLINF